MKWIRLSLLLVLAAVLPAQTEHVILITIDGGAAYHLENPDLALPNIRALIREGVWADSSESVFPSVTYPSHTTLITGMMPRKHGILANELPLPDGKLISAAGLPRREAILSKTIFDTAKAKGLTTAAVAWPETIQDPSIDYNLSGGPGGARSEAQKAWFEELHAHGIPADLLAGLRRNGVTGSTIDDLNTMVVCDTIRNHKPNLLAFHLVNTDHAQHTYGPTHPMAMAALIEVDAMIGRVVKAVKDAGIYDKTAIIVTADHGFTSVYWDINLRPYFAEVGLSDKIRIYEGGWAPFIRTLSNFDEKADGPKLQQVFNKLRRNPHLVRIYTSDEFPSLGLPRYGESDRVRGQYLLVADPDTYFVEAPDNDMELRRRPVPAHGHGYLPQSPKMYPMLVMEGTGFQKGTRIGHVHSVDVAPTISRLLGLSPLDFDGRILTEALVQ